MTPPRADEHPSVDDVAEILGIMAGGYLRSPIVEPGSTCAVCRAPVAPAELCPQCRRQVEGYGSQLADRVGLFTYAPSDSQTARAMHGYKQPVPDLNHRALVILMCHVALRGHRQCADALAGIQVTKWATVPSTRGRQGEHPLHNIVRHIAESGTEVSLDVGTPSPDPREVSPEAFTVLDAIEPDTHVMLIDDTWTRGGHVQSAAVALKVAGAAQVSILVLARWLKMDWPDHAALVRSRLADDFDLDRCPWTGGPCP